MTPPAFRLPTTVRPTRYDVELRVDPDDPMFKGSVRIALALEEPTDTIVLHGRDMIVRGAGLEQGGHRLEAAATLDEEQETITLAFPSEIGVGEAVLFVEFTGKVGRDMSGLYLSQDGNERCLVTQCEATDARAVFPCFDEPAFKAVLAWQVRAPAALTVLANGPEERREEHGDGTVTWRFEPTPPMASYLAAVAIGDFGAGEAIEVGDVPLRVWAMGGREKLGGHANEFAARLLPWYEETFDVPYHFGKYDQVAVPAFSFGAMENVGLVVFRPTLLLMDPATASWKQRKRVDLVVAHEFAHMWFGNLVTMAWWDDLWLNEAFAEWIANEAVHELEPDHDIWFDFQAGASRAMATDALGSTHAIYTPVETPAEATEMFDVITYQKGSAVLRMLDAYLGREAVRRGLSTYMRAFSEANARGADLWRHFEEAAEEPVERIMSGWVNTPGHPAIEVALVGEEDGLARLALRQERFRASPLVEATDETWDVPIVLRYADDDGIHEHRVLLTEREIAHDLPVRGSLQWLYPNADDIGFYRSMLASDLGERLAAHLDVLTPAERIGLVRDQWALVKSGALEVEAFTSLLERLVDGDDHYAVVEQTTGLLEGLDEFLQRADDDEATRAYRAWVADRYGPALAKRGTRPKGDEGPRALQHRASLLRVLSIVAEDDATVADLVELADQERGDASSVDANLAGLAVTVAARHGDPRRFDLHHRTFEARRDAGDPPHAIDRYLFSLAAFRDDALVQRTLTLITDGKLPQQNVGPLVTMMLGETQAQRATWIHVKEHWKTLQDLLGESWIGRLVEATSALPPELREDVVDFFDAHLDGVAQQSYGRAKEALTLRAELHERVLPRLVAWARGLS